MKTKSLKVFIGLTTESDIIEIEFKTAAERNAFINGFNYAISLVDELQDEMNGVTFDKVYCGKSKKEAESYI